MSHQRHFDTNAAAQREAAQIWKMIGELDRSVQLLNADIAIEEERAGIFDRSDPAYPILARSSCSAPRQSDGHRRGAEGTTSKAGSG